MFNLVCYQREEKPREKVLRKDRLLAECYCVKLKVSRKKLIINELLVEAAGVELSRVFRTRKLLILGTATRAKKAPIARSIVRLLYENTLALSPANRTQCPQIRRC